MDLSGVTTGSAETAWCAYLRESARPLTSLVFVIPLLAAYEGGIVLLGPLALRNGVDVWLRWLLETLGFGQYFLLPLLTAAALLAWHHVTRQPWSVRWRAVAGMGLESLLWGGLLLAGAAFVQQLLTAATAAEPLPAASLPGRLAGYCGAGIYEELLFRLLLAPGLALAFVRAGAGPRTSLAGAAVMSSLAFAAAHYRAFTGVAEADALEWASFAFRFLAGLGFAGLFFSRGFGVAAGAHAAYDILVELM